MRSVKAPVFLVAVFLAALASALIIFYKPIAVAIFAKVSGIDISYKKMEAGSVNEFIFKGLRGTERKSGLGLSSSDARIRFIFKGPDPRNAAADFVLKDVSFIKKGIEKEVSYGNIDGLVAVPFNSLWNYREISGRIGLIKNGIRIENFLAAGDLIRFSLNGELSRDQNVNADIGIYFAESLTGKIPPELTSMVLKDGEAGWKSFTVKLEGDLAKPSIRVTGRLFRLNIGVKSKNPS